MLNKKINFWYGVPAILLIVGIFLGMGLSTYVLAASTDVSLPEAPLTVGGTLRDVGGGELTDLTLPSSNQPVEEPPGSQPIATFSGIDAPWILNSKSDPSKGQYFPLEIPDDLVIYGLNEVRQGIVNTTGTPRICLPSAPCTGGPNPVFIYDNLEVKGNGSEPGNLIVRGNLQLADTGAYLQILGTSNIADLNVNGDINVSGNVTANSIGKYYRLSKVVTDSTASVGQIIYSPLTCSLNDIPISCNGSINNASIGSLMGNSFSTSGSITTCETRAKKTSTGTLNVYVQTVCFNPDASPPITPSGAALQNLN